MPKIYSIPLHNAQKLLLLESSGGRSWMLDITDTSPKPLLSGTGDTYLTAQVPLLGHTWWSSLLIPTKSNSGIQGPTAFSSFLFGQSLSFCFVGFKVKENLQPGSTDSSAEERQWGAQYWLGPNTKYNPPPSPGSVLHTQKAGDLAESLTPQLASLHRRKGLTGLRCRMRRPKTQEPSAQSRQVEAGIGSVSVSGCVCVCVCVSMCVCVCMPVPSSCSPD